MDWALLVRYEAGECTDAEQIAVERWLAESPLHRGRLDALRQAIDYAERQATPEEEALRLSRIRWRADGQHPLSGGPRPRWLTRWLAAAAAVILAVGASLAGYRLLTSRAGSATSASTARTIATAPGQRMSLRLSDGTAVLLAPASTLRIEAGYGVRARAVHLDGEAAFTVVHDEARPFSVRTARLIARDLGTRFVVRAYASDSVAHVGVAEGRVAVGRAATADDHVLLLAGDVATATATGRLVAERDRPLDSYFGWTTGKLVFDHTPLEDVVRQLERWHDVDIRLASPSLKRLGFTATLPSSDSAPETLRFVATVLHLRVAQAGPRAYTLRAR